LRAQPKAAAALARRGALGRLLLVRLVRKPIVVYQHNPM